METTKQHGALWKLALISVTIALLTYAYTAWQESQQRFGPTMISVSGEGEVLAKPDIGSFSFSVRAEGDTAAAAQEQSAEATNAILAFLDEAGIEEKDIKTEYYNLNPKYRYEERFCANGFCPPSEPVIDGYEVAQSITVKVRALDTAGDLITGVGERGATNISGLSFTVDDTSTLEAEAREKAIADAKIKAEKLTKDLGMRIVKITNFYEEEGYPMPYGYGGDMMVKSMAMDAAESVSPNLPTGENIVRKRVNISFEVR